TSVTVNEVRVAAVVDPPMSAWLPITRSSVMCVMTVSLSARGSERLVGVRMPNRRAPEPAILHGFPRRLLVFELPDQLTLCIVETASEVRVVGDRHELRTAGQGRPQCDPLLLAAAVLQGDVDIHLTGIPPPQMGRSRRQRLQHVRTLLRYKARSHVDR